MALISDYTESEIKLWLDTFFATLAAQVMGGTAGLQARRLFTTGRALGQADDIAAATATFNQAYVAGKVAGVLGTNTVRKMTQPQLVSAIENSPTVLGLGPADQEVLSLLERNSARTIARRAAVHESKIQEILSVANTRWTGAVQGGMGPAEAATVRHSLLSELGSQVGFQLMGAGSDSKRFMQTELANYFQRGQVQDKNPELEVWKIPRDTAEAQCLRIYLNRDGSPRRYLLKDVLGNSNVGLPPEQWKFVIGATHPYCYCILFEEELTRRPGPNKKLADRREETVTGGRVIPTGPRSQAARRRRSVLPPGTTRAVRIGDRVVPVSAVRRGRKISVARSGANSTEALYKTKTGAWTKQRQKLHEEILQQLEANITVPPGTPTMQLMGGGSASGKGSILKQGVVKPTRNQVFVDSDEIKGMLPEYRAMLAAGDARGAAFVHAESSYLGDLALKRARAKGMNMTLDGTGDGSIEKLRGRVMPQKLAGYKVKADYVYISTDEAIRRSTLRAQQTGREVPEAMIRSTHTKVSRVVPKALDEDLFDEFNLWDNSGKKVELIATKKAGQPLKVLKQQEWDDFLAKATDGAEKVAAVAAPKVPVRAAAPRRPMEFKPPKPAPKGVPEKFAPTPTGRVQGQPPKLDIKPSQPIPKAPTPAKLKPNTVKPAERDDLLKLQGSDPRAVARAERKIAQKQAQAWNEMAEGKISLDDFFEQSMKGTGAKLEGFQVRALSSAERAKLKLPEAQKPEVYFGYKAKIVIADRPQVPVKITRNFVKRGGQWEIDHELLEIGWAGQGTGLAKKILKNDLELYQKMGIKAVNLEAGLEVGGYAWARYGFVPQAAEWQKVKSVILERSKLIMKDLSPTNRTILKDALASRDPKAIWKIADMRTPVKKFNPKDLDPTGHYPAVKPGDEPLGSFLLREQNWKGTLNLTDQTAVSRTMNYIGG